MSDAAVWIKSGRLDLSEWVIHFVHGRLTEHAPEPFAWPARADRSHNISPKEERELEWMCSAESQGIIPTHFESDGPKYWDSDWNDAEYPWADDERAFGVLIKIIKDGFLRSGWAFRNGKATIYGPNSAVCFTEMPLYAVLNYARKRTRSGFVDTYAIALRRDELYRAGARPVIYGLTKGAAIASAEEPEFGLGYRTLKASSLPLHEQYRYVATDLGADTPVDWTHEREWRWTDIRRKFDPPGLPLWIANVDTKFRVLVLVKSKSESRRIRDELKYLYDGGYNRFSIELDRETLLRTSVLALENVSDELLENTGLRLDDLPVDRMRTIKPVKADLGTLAAVKAALKTAEAAGSKAAQEFRKSAVRNQEGHILDACGYAYVRTDESHSKVTAALLELQIAHVLPESGGYELHGLNFGIRQEQSISLEEAAAQAAADALTSELGQPFYMWSRLD